MTNDSEIKLPELLLQLMQEKGVTVEKLTFVTNIPHRFVAALLAGEFKKLPAKPYVRGYLLKIAAALNVEAPVLIRAYKESTELKSSGEADRLPVNRFAIQKLNKNFIIIFLILLLVGGFLTWRINDILGTPSLGVNLPEDTFSTQAEMLKISGEISPGDKLTLNQEIVYTDDAGKFEKEISLLPGLNTFEFSVKRFLGRETRVVRQVFYEEQVNENFESDEPQNP